jgi:hypothetical protein
LQRLERHKSEPYGHGGRTFQKEATASAKALNMYNGWWMWPAQRDLEEMLGLQRKQGTECGTEGLWGQSEGLVSSGWKGNHCPILNRGKTDLHCV